jgi:TRAP-type uncharacterized transport system fused permease subunit
MFANLTPPVALASFAAAGISGGDPMKTGFASVKLALAGFIVPFMFVYSPELMLIDTTLTEGIRVVIGACLGVFLIGVAVEGYLFVQMPWVSRIIAMSSAFGLIDGGIFSDVLGLAGFAVVVGTQHFLLKKGRKTVPAP